MKYSHGNWQAVKNSSWGEAHKENFGDRSGYVICHRKNGQLIALASVIGIFGESQEVIDGNAKLIEDAPRLERLSSELNKRLMNGQDFLMSIEPSKLTVEDCLEAFGFGRDGLGA